MFVAKLVTTSGNDSTVEPAEEGKCLLRQRQGLKPDLNNLAR
jgi:hypothetical protein